MISCKRCIPEYRCFPVRRILWFLGNAWNFKLYESKFQIHANLPASNFTDETNSSSRSAYYTHIDTLTLEFLDFNWICNLQLQWMNEQRLTTKMVPGPASFEKQSSNFKLQNNSFCLGSFHWSLFKLPKNFSRNKNINKTANSWYIF